MIEVEVEDERWRAVGDVEAVVQRAASAVLSDSQPSPLRGEGEGQGWGWWRRGIRHGLATNASDPIPTSAPPPPPNPPPSKGRAPVATLLLTDHETVRDLNARFRGKDAPTNVLSFPAAKTAAPHLGDVALAYEVCAREAGEQGKSLSDHLSHLVVHGVLHLLGYDHDLDSDAEVMEAMERDILARLGVADPYRQDGPLARS